MTSLTKSGSVLMSALAMILLNSSKKSGGKNGKKAAIAKSSNEKSTTGPGDDNNDKKDDKKKKKQTETKEESNDFVSPWGVIDGGKSDSGNDKKEAKYDTIIKELIGNKNSSHNNNYQRARKSGGGGGGDFGDNFFKKFENAPKKLIGLVLLAIASLWLATGFYKVNSDENALVLYFGKFYTIATPGLNYALPTPIGKVVKQSVTRVNSEEFGYVGKTTTTRRFRSKYNEVANNNTSDNLMLTGDENIVDIEFQVQWQIKDIEKFTFNISEPQLTIRKAAESAMREIISVTPISEALSDGKSRIEQDSKALLQKVLDEYNAGVRIVLLQLRRVDPPPQVIDSFRDVQTAKADKEKEINEAQAYANDIIPRARGNAAEMQEKALAYKNRVTADAQGEAKRFTSLYSQYRKAKDVTRRRMYLETMQKVYGDIDKVIIDSKLSKGSLMPYFPLGDLKSGRSKAN